MNTKRKKYYYNPKNTAQRLRPQKYVSEKNASGGRRGSKILHFVESVQFIKGSFSEIL